jgi:hypothetical protein
MEVPVPIEGAMQSGLPVELANIESIEQVVSHIMESIDIEPLDPD